MKKVTRFESKDGRLYETEQEAKVADLEYDLETALMKMLVPRGFDVRSHPLDDYVQTTVSRIAARVVRRAAEADVAALIKMFEKYTMQE